MLLVVHESNVSSLELRMFENRSVLKILRLVGQLGYAKEVSKCYFDCGVQIELVNIQLERLHLGGASGLSSKTSSVGVDIGSRRPDMLPLPL